MMKFYGYQKEEPPEAGQVRALFEIAEALRDVARALSYGGGEGMSVAESIVVAGEGLAEALEAQDGDG